jgi:hypothetical protein
MTPDVTTSDELALEILHLINNHTDMESGARLFAALMVVGDIIGSIASMRSTSGR